MHGLLRFESEAQAERASRRWKRFSSSRKKTQRAPQCSILRNLKPRIGTKAGNLI